MSTCASPGSVVHPKTATGRWRLRLMLLGGAALGVHPEVGLGAQGTGDHTQAWLEQSVGQEVRPGDDFFSYANGAWLRATVIPAGRDRWGARNAIDVVTERQMAELFEAVRHAPAGSLARKVADFRAAWLNEDRIEARGLAPLQPALDSIDRVQDRTALTRLLGASVLADVDPLNWGIYQSSSIVGLSVEQGLGGEGVYLPFLVQGGLGLPDRESYLSTDSGPETLRHRYQTYVSRLLVLSGRDDADRRAAAVLALETELAKGQATPEVSADDGNAANLWSRTEFASQAPGMDWSVFLSAAGLAQAQRVVAWQPGAVRAVAAQVATTPLSVWKDYLRFHLLDHYADVLPRAYAGEALAFHTAAGESPRRPRADRALAATRSAMSDILGELYAERYLPPRQKEKVQGIVAAVLSAFIDRVNTARWMSPQTRRIALTKLRTLYVGVGYPEHWADASDLLTDPGDALGNLRRVEARAGRLALARLGRPIDRSDWLIAPQTVGALLSFQQNAYDCAAALLQAPRYDSTASLAANYGSIGAIIGHDISHFVDRLGADYDPTGRKRRWWTATDSAGFEAMAAPLVAQYDAYHPFPEVALDGRRTETENVADLAGLTAAFDAYRRTLGARASDSAYVREQDRQFFLGFAQAWRIMLSDSALRSQALTSDHSPDPYRVETVRNLDAWYEAFDVRPGDRLYLAPETRVRVW